MSFKVSKQESLTKENFWNEVYEKYPKGCQVFCDWIDAYKEANGWLSLFGEHETKDRGRTVCCGFAAKFHHLPLAMQIGIWIEFASLFTKISGHPWEIEDLTENNWRQDITEAIALLDGDDDYRAVFIKEIKTAETN